MTATMENKRVALKRRIRQFYAALNERGFQRCHRMIDPRVRAKPSSVTLHQYQESLEHFLNEYGLVKIVVVEMQVHVNEPTPLYEGRDFAVGRTTWIDANGTQHVFSERWVRDQRSWYTRSTGFVVSRPNAGALGLARKQARGLR